MLTIYLAHTSPINPPTATPVLSRSQLWAGLQRKIRHAQEFVPAIASCTVLADVEGVVTREVVFKAGAGPEESAREKVRGFGEVWVEFEKEDGSVIRNMISDGGDGDLYLTYSFEFRFEDMEEGSREAEEQTRKLKGMSKMAVEKSIETIRQMVLDGRIKA